MKWEAEWWGITLIAESPNGELSDDMKLLTDLAKRLTVQAEECYEYGTINIEDEFIDNVRVFKIIFNR